MSSATTARAYAIRSCARLRSLERQSALQETLMDRYNGVLYAEHPTLLRWWLGFEDGSVLKGSWSPSKSI